MEDSDKVIRLVEYLTQLARLRTKVTRDVNEYQDVLWINDIPRKTNGCFTLAWGSDANFDSNIWIEIQNRKEPPLPNVPSICEEWVEKASLRNKNDIPELLSEITKYIKNSHWQKGSDEPGFVPRIERLEDHLNVQKAWDKYVDEHWFPWVDKHNDWEPIHRVYVKFFTIHQEQLRLGEEYELVLALGLLTWQTPSGQRVRRHVIVANAVLEFEAQLAKFTVRPLPDGAKVRPELDMLDVQDQPANSEQTMKTSLAEPVDDDPWNKSVVEGALRALVHSIDSQGEFNGSLEATSVRVSDKPIVDYAPALILRKRSARGLTETLKRMKERIENGENIPPQFTNLAEIQTNGNGISERDPGETSGSFDGELFFPKPWNDEQLRIAEKIRTTNGVLVQGPPGTGKSHTIANLICHLLATGQRTLITAKTPRALRVLENLVPKELRPLYINLLGGGSDERKSLESSVSGILQKDSEWNENQAASQIENFERKLRELRKEKAAVDKRLRDIRESETYSQSIAEGTYQGTAVRIAEAVNRNRSAHQWFTDTAPFETPCPVEENLLRELLNGLRQFVPERRKELGQEWLEDLISVEEFDRLVASEKKAIQEYDRWSAGADEYSADVLSDIASEKVKAVHKSLAAFEDLRYQLSASPHTWMGGALRDIIGGSALMWRERHRTTQTAIAIVEPLVSVANHTRFEFPDGSDIQTLLESADELKNHLVNGGRLNWWTRPFQSGPIREHRHLLKGVMINGCRCTNLEQFSVLTAALTVRNECDKAWQVWTGHHERKPGSCPLQLLELTQLHDALAQAISLDVLIENCRAAIRECPSLPEPRWIDESEVKTLLAACRTALASRDKNRATENIRKLQEPVVALAGRANSHPVTGKILSAICSHDVDGYRQAVNETQRLVEESRLLQNLDGKMDHLRRLVPNLTADVENTCNYSHWNERIHRIGDAWHWAQAKFWVDEYITKEDSPSLSIRSRQIEDEINKVTAKLAELYAWAFCLNRLEGNHRSHMVAWQQAMRRLGKGTGKHAPKNRRDAQRHLNECREAVPAWVMPLHRVWDTVDPAPGMFDVVIIDEASQCGPEALPLLYLGEKVLIVGDDKQISPEAVGLDRNAVHSLMNQFLFDFNFRDSFAVESSLFDHGKRLYPQGHITLQEHFRCMPEIIRFSNDLCYFAMPLIPLRQYGPDRLTPLAHIFVEEGYREGSHNKVVNIPEADAIVQKIVELCDDKRYSDKTMGVVVLQGEAQAGLIEGKLLERLGAEEMETRHLVCGNAYSFQGDERNVMFLSMVAAVNETIGPLTDSTAERRFNVAASRAQDQMFLFHSVTVNDLSKHDLRRKLLEFCTNTKPPEIAGIVSEELERRATQDNRAVIKPPEPFDSWFEVDVALELARRHFKVQPQYEVAGKRIDLVIEGGIARLAVECDGDKWHGVDQYEKDVRRQRQLERCGWEFFRVRESAFRANKESALERLWPMLEERRIFPNVNGFEALLGENESESNEPNIAEATDNSYDDDLSLPLVDGPRNAGNSRGRRTNSVTSSDIKAAILQALRKCPNQSCTKKSMTKLVLKELHIVTRGRPRKNFEDRVKRSLKFLEERSDVESYKSKNERIRLIRDSV